MRKICNSCRPMPTPLVAAMLMAAVILGLAPNGMNSAYAQMMNEPWGFSQQNRASIAALIKQTEDADSTGSTAGSAGGYDQLICGGDGQSSATANSTCIILNNSDASIQIGQDAQGDQDAVNNAEISSADDLSDALQSAQSADE